MVIDRKKVFLRLTLIGVLASLAALAFTNSRIASSFALGCLLMILNFYGLFALLHKIFVQDTRQIQYIVLLGAKFVVMGLVIYGCFKLLNLHLLAFGLGFFTIAISATYVTGSMQNHPKDNGLDGTS